MELFVSSNRDRWRGDLPRPGGHEIHSMMEFTGALGYGLVIVDGEWPDGMKE